MAPMTTAENWYQLAFLSLHAANKEIQDWVEEKEHEFSL